MFAHLRRSDDERRQRRDELDEDLFFDPELLGPLGDLFHGKCAFCESETGSDALCHHFRPLRFATGPRPPDKEHYIWLAFEWRNLLLSCPYCAKAKDTAFPVKEERAALLAMYEDVLEQEDALLLDPTLDEPSRHLRFRTTGRCDPLTLRGHTTIRLLDLNRDALVDARRALTSDILGIIQARDTAGNGQQLVSPVAAHAGAMLGIMKRVATAWRASQDPIRGTGFRFAHNFWRAIREAGAQSRRRLERAVDEIRVVDDEAATAPETAYEDFVSIATMDEAARVTRLPPAADRELASIEIRGFKAIEQLNVPMGSSRDTRAGVPCLMILGENSTGKSSLLAAMAVALIGRREAAKLRLNPAGLVHSQGLDQWDQLDEQPVEATVRFHFSDHLATFRYDPVRRLVEGGDEPACIVLGYGPRRFFSPKLRHRGAGAAARVRTLFDPLATIPYPGDWLGAQRGERFHEIAAALRIVLALDDDDELVIEPGRGVCVRANGRMTPIDWLSEGYRSVFAMTVDIIRELIEHGQSLARAQAVVLIDELENHLHPRWKMQVMSSLRRVLPRVQFIVTTHDPLCLRGMDDGEVMVLLRDSDDRIHPLEGLPSVKGMTAEQLLTSDYFGLSSTADPAAELELARLTGDVARVTPDGAQFVPSRATSDLVSRLTIGDSQSEQIVQDALQHYLEEREKNVGTRRIELRAEAVDAVLKALRADPS